MLTHYMTKAHLSATLREVRGARKDAIPIRGRLAADLQNSAIPIERAMYSYKFSARDGLFIYSTSLTMTKFYIIVFLGEYIIRRSHTTRYRRSFRQDRHDH